MEADDWFWVVVLCSIAFVIGGALFQHDKTPEELKTKAEQEAACAKPKKITQADGVELWAYNWCEDYPVYFSKSGAQWNTEEHYGKGQTRIIPHQVPSAESQ